VPLVQTPSPLENSNQTGDTDYTPFSANGQCSFKRADVV
jgi:hypothetical protein